MSNNGHPLSEQHLSVRITLWAALITVHSILLVVGFSLVVMSEAWNGHMALAYTWFAFFGLLFPIANTASSLAALQESLIHRDTGAAPVELAARWRSFRPHAWIVSEIGSLAMLSFCAAIMVYWVSNAG
jgi:hypothetical protein